MDNVQVRPAFTRGCRGHPIDEQAVSTEEILLIFIFNLKKEKKKEIRLMTIINSFFLIIYL